MEKMSSDLHVKKMEDVSKLVISCFFKKKNYTSLLSPHPHGLQHRQVGLDDDLKLTWLNPLLFFIQHFPFQI